MSCIYFTAQLVLDERRSCCLKLYWQNVILPKQRKLSCSNQTCTGRTARLSVSRTVFSITLYLGLEAKKTRVSLILGRALAYLPRVLPRQRDYVPPPHPFHRFPPRSVFARYLRQSTVLDRANQFFVFLRLVLQVLRAS